jgi:anti-anti-sigma factor
MHREPGSLDVRVLSSGSVVVVALVGELDRATSPHLQRHFDEILRSRHRPRVNRLVLDCRELAAVDASSIWPVLHARAVLSRRQGTLEVRRPSPATVHVLDLLDLTESLLPRPAGVAG